jgi:hypothetical protein
LNYAFGSSFGTGLEAHVYGSAFAFADVLKTAAPIAARRSFASRSWGAALLASLAWAIFTAGSAISAVGFASANRTFTVDSRKVQAALNRNRLASLEADQSELRRLRERLGTPEVGRSERLQLTAAAQRLEAAIGATRGKLEDAAPVVSTPNPQAHTLSNLTGLEMDKVETSLTLLAALLVEVGGLGPFILTILAKGRDEQEAAVKVHGLLAERKPPTLAKVHVKVPEERRPAPTVPSRNALNGHGRNATAVAPGRAPQRVVRPTPTGDAVKQDLQRFLDDRTLRNDHSALASSELLARFNQFRRGHGRAEVSHRRLGDAMASLGYRNKARLAAGRVFYRGLAWAHEAAEVDARSGAADKVNDGMLVN